MQRSYEELRDQFHRMFNLVCSPPFSKSPNASYPPSHPKASLLASALFLPPPPSSSSPPRAAISPAIAQANPEIPDVLESW